MGEERRNLFSKSFRWLLAAYDESDYILAYQARFIFYFSLASTAVLLIMLLYSALVQVIDPAQQTLNLPMLAVESFGLVSFFIILALVARGRDAGGPSADILRLVDHLDGHVSRPWDSRRPARQHPVRVCHPVGHPVDGPAQRRPDPRVGPRQYPRSLSVHVLPEGWAGHRFRRFFQLHGGCDRDPASPSPTALAHFQQVPDAYDLVITDMTMPKMTGDMLAQKIRLKRPDIPVIMCTGFSEVMDEQKAEDLGIDAFLNKPVVLENMLETIRKVLEVKR